MTEQAHAGHEDQGHGHGHASVFIQHHYDDAKHQFDSGKLGIWLFLAQEVLFFSALFVAYVLYRHHHPEIYEYAHKYLDTKMGAINTAVLIFSSLTAAWAVRAAQLNQKKLLIACLSATIACAGGFLVIKYVEYTHKIHEHILFGRYFDPCVSSGGTPLLTKNNECPGSKANVVFDFGSGKAKSGCLALADYDNDPAKAGMQASCKVTVETGKVSKKADGSSEFVVTKSEPITDVCHDPYWDPPVHNVGHGEAAKGEKAPTAAHGGHGKKCWRPAYQPAVCKKDFGVIVEFGDHEVRHNSDTRVVADCTKAAKVPEPIDPLADQVRDIPIGAKEAAGRQTLSHHEEKERNYAGPPPPHTNMFFTIYFAMTGLHGIHVLVGIFVFIWLLLRAVRGDFSPDYFGPVDFAALYWHIVDLIWIFLFPLLYLIH